MDELLTLAARVFGVAAGLITSAITARVLGPGDRGEFFYVVATAAVLAQFGHLGTPGANTYFCAPAPGLARRLLRWNLVLGTAAGVVLATVFLTVTSSPLISGAAPRAGALWLIPLTATVLLLTMLGPVLAGLHAFGTLNLLMVAYQGGLLLAFVGVALVAPSAENFLAASAIGAVLAVAGHVWAVARRPVAERTTDLTVRSWLAYGRKAYLILILGGLLPRLGLFAVKVGSTSEQLGYYSIAVQAFDALTLLPASFATILFPMIMRGGDRSWTSCKREVSRMLLLATALAVVAGLAMPFAVRIIFGAEFLGVTPIAIAFLPGFVALSVVTVASQYLAALGYPRAVTVNWLVATGVLALASMLLVPLDQGRGAAVASSLAYIVLAILMLRTARKLLLKGAT